MVAQDRGSYEDALSWYRKSLEIEEELGDRSGMASTIGQLGVLATERGEPEAGVPLTLRSLGLRMEMGVLEVGIDLQWLNRQQEMLGAERFGEVLDEHLDEEGRERVLDLMEQYREAAAKAEESGEGE